MAGRGPSRIMALSDLVWGFACVGYMTGQELRAQTRTEVTISAPVTPAIDIT